MWKGSELQPLLVLWILLLLFIGERAFGDVGRTGGGVEEEAAVDDSQSSVLGDDAGGSVVVDMRLEAMTQRWIRCEYQTGGQTDASSVG